jgi:signal transduction histidine kinase/ligand-binding sensor domain-containing protein/DNA-binding response OmpR family regulator
VIGTKFSRWGITINLENRFCTKIISQSANQLLTFYRSFRNFLLLISAFLIFSPCINPQQADYQFEVIHIEEGTPTSIQYIYQDKIGYLWFATWSGLYKYDGYNFTSYKNDVEDTTSLFDNTLSTIYEDKSGILWIGSRLGLERFDPKYETFIHYTPNPADTGDNESNQIYAIHEDNKGDLWIGSGDGLFTFDKNAEKFSSLQCAVNDSESIFHNSIQVIYGDSEGTIWIGGKLGLCKFDSKTDRFESIFGFTWPEKDINNLGHSKHLKYWNYSVNRFKPVTSGANERINAIIEDEKKILWLGTEGGLVQFNPQENIYKNYLYNPSASLNTITSMCQDINSGVIWLATVDGLYSFDKKNKKFTHYNSEANYVLDERSGSLWVGTKTEIKKLNRTKQFFKKYLTDVPVQAIRNGKAGILWMLTFKGQFKFDIQQDKFVPHSPGKDYVWFVWDIRGDISYRREAGGLYILDTLGNLIFSLDASMDDYINTATMGYSCKSGFWCGFENGDLDLWDHKTNRIIKVANFKRRINLMFEDSYGFLWVSTFMGSLFHYDLKRNKYIEFVYDPRKPSSLSGNIVNKIYEDAKGRLWFLTNNGLNKLEQATNTFARFGDKQGFPSKSMHGIAEDKNGNLWISTTRGISRFNPETNAVKNYDASYGIDPPADVSFGDALVEKNGEMYFSGSRGFTKFHPDSIKDNPFIPPIVITSFKKFDKTFRIEKEIRLAHDENFLSFEFAALSYLSNERNQYAYMMEGLDRDWVHSGTRRFASYPNLDPGEYVFRVKGSNNDGIWNEAGTSISIIISPPWWKTTWAYILYSILILSMIYTTWKMQVKRIRIRHEYEMSKFETQKLHEVDEIKSRFFTNISHEFRTPLTLILGPVKQIIERTKEEKTRDDLKVVNKNANRLLGLVNQLLDISKLESGNMKLQTSPENIVQLLKALVLSFTSYAERKRITLKFNSSQDEIIVYIDKDKVEKMITNVLSNAFKFTPEGGRIEVTLKPSSFPPLVKGELKGGFVEISVRDTGIGIPKEKLSKIFDRFYQVDGSHTREQEGTGIGLALTKELVELHKGTIEVESEAGKCTIVTISLPLGKEHLKLEEICEQSLSLQKESFGQTLSKGEGFSEQTIFPEETKTEKDISLITETDKPFLLIVEDNSDVRNYIKNNLEKDYRILEAVDGEDGWNKALEHMADLIVSDVMMPKMDGFELCKKLKTDEQTSHIPIILLTAKAASSDKIEGYEIGADDYIMKPFEPAELKARIKNLIEQRKRIHEHFKKHGLFEIEERNITPVDQKFLQKAVSVINEHISDTTFGVEVFAEKMNVSRSLIFKKINSLTGEPPIELIKRIRLNKAASLIGKDFGNISEIALEVGFSNPSYFSECFKKQFGVAPSNYHQYNKS